MHGYETERTHILLCSGSRNITKITWFWLSVWHIFLATYREVVATISFLYSNTIFLPLSPFVSFNFSKNLKLKLQLKLTQHGKHCGFMLKAIVVDYLIIFLHTLEHSSNIRFHLHSKTFNAITTLLEEKKKLWPRLPNYANIRTNCIPTFVFRMLNCSKRSTVFRSSNPQNVRMFHISLFHSKAMLKSFWY